MTSSQWTETQRNSVHPLEREIFWDSVRGLGGGHG